MNSYRMLNNIDKTFKMSIKLLKDIYESPCIRQERHTTGPLSVDFTIAQKCITQKTSFQGQYQDCH